MTHKLFPRLPSPRDVVAGCASNALLLMTRAFRFAIGLIMNRPAASNGQTHVLATTWRHNVADVDVDEVDNMEEDDDNNNVVIDIENHEPVPRDNEEQGTFVHASWRMTHRSTLSQTTKSTTTSK